MKKYLSIITLLLAFNITTLINEYRVIHGLSKLYVDYNLMETSKAKSIFISKDIKNNFNHNGLRESLDNSAYKWQHAGEILAFGYNTNDGNLLEAWIHSPSHKKVMDDNRWDDIACYQYKTVATCRFGTNK